jgi:hypothetical protein
MLTLSAGDLLTLWERGASLHPIDRALQVLAIALPDRPWRDLARVSLGERDALLLEVRRATLGDRIAAQDTCQACGERVEIDLTCSALIGEHTPSPGAWLLEHDGYHVTLRCINSEDAAAAAMSVNVAIARSQLLERCVVSASRDEQPVQAIDLPEPIVSAAAASMADHDTRAELVLDLTCPACERRWQRVLDVVRFVWIELTARAQQLIADIHTLARAYGWSEAEILAMSDARRTAYLSLVTA